MRDDVAVVIFAGGEGRRLGGGKPLTLLDGERLIDRALRHAAQWSDLVAVVVRDPAQVAPLDVRVITDEPEIPGPLAGLASALRFGEKATANSLSRFLRTCHSFRLICSIAFFTRLVISAARWRAAEDICIRFADCGEHPLSK